MFADVAGEGMERDGKMGGKEGKSKWEMKEQRLGQKGISMWPWERRYTKEVDV